MKFENPPVDPFYQKECEYHSENCLWEMGKVKQYERKQGNLIKHLLEKIKESLEYLGFPGLNLYLQRIIEPNTF